MRRAGRTAAVVAAVALGSSLLLRPDAGGTTVNASPDAPVLDTALLDRELASYDPATCTSTSRGESSHAEYDFKAPNAPRSAVEAVEVELRSQLPLFAAPRILDNLEVEAIHTAPSPARQRFIKLAFSLGGHTLMRFGVLDHDGAYYVRDFSACSSFTALAHGHKPGSPGVPAG